MSQEKRQLHLNIQTTFTGHPAAWRTEEGRRTPGDDIAHFQEIARTAERGLLNAVFLADSPSLTETGEGPVRSLDPVVIVAAAALATERLGLILTASTTFNLPYNLARQILSLDHLSKGRVGWNIVTTSDPNAAGNFGLDKMPDNETRYAKAAEFADVVLKLWDSWEEGALVGDAKTGQWADRSRVHAINHKGPHYSVRGPLQVARSPQGRPLIVQAGSSPEGRNFAAGYAEAIFTVQTLRREAEAYYTDIKTRVRRHGRDPEKVAILPGLSLVIGSTEAEAKARLAYLDGVANDHSALERFAQRLGIDVAELDFDKPFPEHLIDKVKPLNMSTGHQQARVILLKERSLTVREIIAKGSGGHQRLIGSPEQIADFMEDWFNGGAADGFNMFFDMYPASVATFVDHVVPVLQKRGLHRTEYTAKTLRGHYGLEQPENSLVAARSRSTAALEGILSHELAPSEKEREAKGVAVGA